MCDMLEFALEYEKALDAMMDKRKLGLEEYELDSSNWQLVKQLCSVLKASTMLQAHCSGCDILVHRYSRMPHSTSHAEHPTLQWSSL